MEEQVKEALIEEVKEPIEEKKDKDLKENKPAENDIDSQPIGKDEEPTAKVNKLQVVLDDPYLNPFEADIQLRIDKFNE